jgi:hypothetical protein
MGMINKYKWLILLVIVAAAGGSYLYVHFYARGINALLAFSASYERFDKAISEFSLSRTDDLGRQAGEALGDLQARSTFRLSSLIKNYGALMDQARELAALAQKELESLRAGGEGLAKESGVLHEKRIAAYARFQAMGEKKDGNRD